MRLLIRASIRSSQKDKANDTLKSIVKVTNFEQNDKKIENEVTSDKSLY